MFDIKRPTKTVDIVTDLETLAQAVDLKQQIDDAAPNTSAMTEAETGAAVKAQNALRRELKAKLKTIDESTVTFTLRGLGSSQWNQIVLATTTVDQKTGKQFIGGTNYNFIITTAFAVQHKAALCVGLFASKMQIADDDVTTVYSNCVFYTQFRRSYDRLPPQSGGEYVVITFEL